MDSSGLVEVAQDAQEALDKSEVAAERAEEAAVKAEIAEGQWTFTNEMHQALSERVTALEDRANKEVEEVAAPEEGLSSEAMDEATEAPQVVEEAVVEAAPPQKRPKSPESRRIFG